MCATKVIGDVVAAVMLKFIFYQPLKKMYKVLERHFESS